MTRIRSGLYLALTLATISLVLTILSNGPQPPRDESPTQHVTEVDTDDPEDHPDIDNSSPVGAHDAPSVITEEEDFDGVEHEETRKRIYSAYSPGEGWVRSTVTRNLDQTDLESLFVGLNDPDWVAYWAFIVSAIGYLGHQGEAEFVLVDFVAPATENLEPFTQREATDIYFAKEGALRALGHIRGEYAVTFLRNLLTLNGVSELVSQWDTDFYRIEKNHLKADLRAKAATGLVYTRDPENIAIVEKTMEQLYELLTSEKRKELSDEEADLLLLSYSRLRDPLGEIGALAEIGEEVYFDLDGLEWMQVLMPHKRYPRLD